MRTLTIIVILTILTFSSGCGKEGENPIVSLISAPIRLFMPPKTPDVAPESVESERAINGKYDGLLLVASCVGVFLCIVGRYKVGVALLGSGVAGFVLLDILSALRIWIMVGGTLAIIGGLGYLAWHLYNKQTLQGSFKFT